MKKFNCVIGILISSIFLISGCGSGCNAGEGKKIGRVVKIGEHGMICSTYEAEIIRGGFNDGSGVNGAALNFTIKNKKLYDELTSAMESQEEIELSFKRKEFTGPCYSETGIIATGFRILDNAKKVESKEKQEFVTESSLVEETKSIELEKTQSNHNHKTPVVIKFEDDTL